MFKNYLPGYYRLLEMMPIGFKYNLVDGTTDQYLGITNIGFASAQYFYDATAVNLIGWKPSATAYRRRI